MDKFDIGVISGAFNPLHSGHLNYIADAKSRCHLLYVIVNSDHFSIRKRGYSLLTQTERIAIIKKIRGVTKVFPADNKFRDDVSLELMKIRLMNKQKSIGFFNGGDRTQYNTPETDICRLLDIKVLYDVGGVKTQSSSKIIEDFVALETAERDWGYWSVLKFVLDPLPNRQTKVKELVVHPGKSLSDQRHSYRNEVWFVVSGVGEVKTDKGTIRIYPGKVVDIPLFSWHKLSNTGNKNLHIIEVQYGSVCDESDIMRRD